MKKLLQSALVAIVALLSNAAYSQEKDIVDIAAGSEVHTTLVASVKVAGLAETLKSAGPFTVFAPVNDAFTPQLVLCMALCVSLTNGRN